MLLLAARIHPSRALAASLPQIDRFRGRSAQHRSSPAVHVQRAVRCSLGVGLFATRGCSTTVHWFGRTYLRPYNLWRVNLMGFESLGHWLKWATMERSLVGLLLFTSTCTVYLQTLRPTCTHVPNLASMCGSSRQTVISRRTYVQQ